jgi:GNAT superfamily N-acetyltransferase
LGAISYNWLYNDALVAAVVFWYSGKGYRGGAGGMRMFRAFEDWASQIGAKRLSVGNLARLMPEKFEKFYRRRGYEFNEVNFTKIVP